MSIYVCRECKDAAYQNVLPRIAELEADIERQRAAKVVLQKAFGEQVARADAAIQAAGQRGWIPIAEAAHECEDGMECLVYTHEWGVTFETFRVKGTYAGFFWRTTPEPQVTHWMPIPNPPTARHA